MVGHNESITNYRFPVEIALREITRNGFFHLRMAITRNYVFITFMKEIQVSRN